MKKIWTWIKRIFLVILIIHVCWFLFFVFTLSEAIEIKDSKQTLVIVIVAIIILALVYFFWLRKIKPVKKDKHWFMECSFCRLHPLLHLFPGRLFIQPAYYPYTGWKFIAGKWFIEGLYQL